jgi:hypothetical protein
MGNVTEDTAVKADFPTYFRSAAALFAPRAKIIISSRPPNCKDAFGSEYRERRTCMQMRRDEILVADRAVR